MKNLLIIIILLSHSMISAQTLDIKTKNIITAKFIEAKNYFEVEKFNEVISNIEEIEELTGKPTLATAIDLKVKTLIELDQLELAEQQIEVLMNMNLSTEIIKNIAIYNSDILERKKEIEIEISRKKEIERKKKEEDEALANAYKDFRYISCTNSRCDGGQIHYTERVKCGGDDDPESYRGVGCRGKGYIMVGVLRGPGIPYDSGRRTHEKCKGTGNITVKKSKTCNVCKGENKLLDYTGDYPFSSSQITSIIENQKYSIDKALLTKAKFLNNTSLKLLSFKSGGKVGFINESLDIVIPAQYDHADDMIDDRAIVRKDGLQGIINMKNEQITPIVFDNIKRYDNFYIFKKDGVYMKSNFDGEIEDEKFSSLTQIFDDVILLTPIGSNSSKLITRNSEIDKVDSAVYSYLNKNIIYSKNGLFGMLDIKGYQILEPIYLEIDNIGDYLYRCKSSMNKWIIFDIKNSFKSVEFDEVTKGKTNSFINIKNDNKYGIYSDGQLTDPIYKMIYTPENSNFHGTLIATNFLSQKGVINNKGEIIIPFNFYDIKMVEYELYNRFLCMETEKSKRKRLLYSVTGEFVKKVKIDR
ncbi:WG repeat-containing protein [Nonlabens sp. Asnod3-H03]|uniref:WG repeat-containing protein n=1 Tax=Nonlabens sp. Asnod3-H03 TaxID=3160580 RepID=UPI00386C23BE